MNLDVFCWLLSKPGQTLLAEAMQCDLRESERLRVLTHLRKHGTVEQATTAYDTALLRQRAAHKFARANEMFFTREALEQASGEHIAAYRANRFAAYECVGDFCCGIGGDALALAQRTQVHAVDLDPLRLAMARENARVHGLQDRVKFIEADLMQMLLPPLEAIFFDPARRVAGKRLFKLADYVPPVSLVNNWRKQVKLIGVKVAPGIGDGEIAALRDAEVEFISVDGDLKEAVLWFGEGVALMQRPQRRATLLTSGSRITRDASQITPATTISEPLAYLYEPDPAIIRAHLVADLAQEIGAAQLDAQIAYLTSAQLNKTPLARCWRVIEWLPFHLKTLRARLRALDAGAVTVKKRGSPLDTDVLARQLSGVGARELVVVLTKCNDKPIVLICEGPV